MPTDYRNSDKFFSPAPLAPYAHALSAFDGNNPNGTWSLYVQDDQAPDAGEIGGGWLLQLIPQGMLSSIVPQATLENQVLQVDFSVNSSHTAASNVLVTAISYDENPAGLIDRLTLVGSGTQRSLIITPKANWPSAVTNVNGTCTILLTITDGILTNSLAFPMTVVFQDQPPTITGLSDQITLANSPLLLNFMISDVDTPVSNLLVFASVASQLLGVVSMNETIVGISNSLTYLPTGTLGTNLVTIFVSDGTLTKTDSFHVATTLASSRPPLLSASTVGNHLKIRFAGAVPLAKQVLQHSDDLNRWADSGTVPADATGAGEFDVLLDGTTTAQFYRVLTGL